MNSDVVMRNEKCPCRKKKCERHGDCDACRAHHAGNKRPPACERHKTIGQRLAGFVGKQKPPGDTISLQRRKEQAACYGWKQ